MNNPFLPFLRRQPFVVLDGALATELETLGADLNDPLWSAKVLIEAPQLIREVYDSYLRAGADIISTATYQASYAGFRKRGIDQKAAAELFTDSVALAAGARSDFWAAPANRQRRQRPLIAASLGPYGAYLADGSEYHGNYGLSQTDLEEWHRPQIAAFAKNPEVDFLAFETIPSLLEARAIVRVLEDFPQLGSTISFSCKDGRHLSHGEPFSEAIGWLSNSPQIWAVGINCTAPEFIAPLLRAVPVRSEKLLMVYPNSGEAWDAEQHCWRDSGQFIAIPAQVGEWYKLGARLIGGCCRTTPEQIRAIRKKMDQLIESLEGSQ